MAKDLQSQLMAYLKDAHALEMMSLDMTSSGAKTANDPEMTELFEHHHEETQQHEKLIRGRIEAYGESPSTTKDISGRFAAIGKAMASKVPSDTPARLARDAYTHEHLEIAAYELLSRIAQRAGDTETTDVVRRILQQEQQTASKIANSWDHICDLTLREAGVAA
jgi:ferritin-like metal-binding protein YciE